MATKVAAGGDGATKKPVERVQCAFTVPYNTRFGENLIMVGSVEEMGMWDPAKGLRMVYQDPGLWTAVVDLAAKVRTYAGPRMF